MVHLKNPKKSRTANEPFLKKINKKRENKRKKHIEKERKT